LVCVLWVRSYWHRDGVYRAETSPDGMTWAIQSFQSSSGMLWVDVKRGTYRDRSIALYEWQALQRVHKEAALRSGVSATVRPGAWTYSDVPPLAGGPTEQSFGIRYVRTRDQISPGIVHSWLSAGIPHALVAALAMILPAVKTWSRLRRRRRHRVGLCPQCGYDLRATPRRCPECGIEAAGVG
jgi:hypothetical protein